MKNNKFFLDLKKAPNLLQMEGLETKILTGLNGEKMMMVLNSTLPGYTVPLHSHPHEQIGVVHAHITLIIHHSIQKKARSAICSH